MSRPKTCIQNIFDVRKRVHSGMYYRNRSLVLYLLNLSSFPSYLCSAKRKYTMQLRTCKKSNTVLVHAMKA